MSYYQELMVALDENIKLKEAIRKHRSARGHDRCWENDLELYKVLGESLPASPQLPPKEEFLKCCQQYYEQQSKKAMPDDI